MKCIYELTKKEKNGYYILLKTLLVFNNILLMFYEYVKVIYQGNQTLKNIYIKLSII